jgi:hypothetical protein
MWTGVFLWARYPYKTDRQQWSVGDGFGNGGIARAQVPLHVLQRGLLLVKSMVRLMVKLMVKQATT